jgi:hypothetical protein
MINFKLCCKRKRLSIFRKIIILREIAIALREIKRGAYESKGYILKKRTTNNRDSGWGQMQKTPLIN